MRTDGKKNMTKVTAAFHNFANLPKIQKNTTHKVQVMVTVKSNMFRHWSAILREYFIECICWLIRILNVRKCTV
jgi:hypothetical protein